MRIYSMTATFGKLSHQTLTLKPGLNVLHAPNEWGKSTWCAFLVAMLYGIDTRERTTQTSLAEKERYAPWSGEPMSGRMDIRWNDRDITIERHTRGRSVFGVFHAYETESGLPVPELTAANCGQTLLGVEKSVFTKSAFLRLTDLPVEQDKALRRRLNALVTTGDESGESEALEQKLRELKNRCRHNKTGLLPQAETQRDDIANKLGQLKALQTQIQRIRDRQAALEQQIKDLENHRQALEYEAAREGALRLKQAQKKHDESVQLLQQLTARCQMLPSQEFARQQLQQLRQVHLQQNALDAEILPAKPSQPKAPDVFAHMTAGDAMQQAKSDKAAFDMLSKPLSPAFLILGAICVLAGVGLMLIRWYLLFPGVLLSTVFLLLYLYNRAAQTRDRQAIVNCYGTLEPEQWVPLAQKYLDDMAKYSEEEAAVRAVSESLQNRRQDLHRSILALTQGLTLEESIRKWESVVSEHDALANAQHTAEQLSDRVADLSATAKTVLPPEQPDSLTLSAEATARELAAASAEHRQLHLQLGQHLGQMDALGQEESLVQQLTAVESRIARLEDTYAALVIAMDTLSAASDDLQRRFAPRISQQAQALFAKLTGSRYTRLQLTEDLSLRTCAGNEDNLRSVHWRSDGTVDQLYLALRLAVARELTPNAPLILDDALVRFDDTRLALAMDILKEESQTKQVLLFTCHNREAALA